MLLDVFGAAVIVAIVVALIRRWIVKPVRLESDDPGTKRDATLIWLKEQEDAGIDIAGPVPPRRFDEASLVRVAAIPTTVRCECPHHLADLIGNLAAFERYSEECEIRSRDDAALHAYLHAASARARSLIETALARVIEAEGIRLEEN